MCYLDFSTFPLSPVSIVSLGIPRIVVSLEILSVGSLRFPGFSYLTRDSRNRCLTRDSRIPGGGLQVEFWKSVKRKIRYHVVAGRHRLTRDSQGAAVSLETPPSPGRLGQNQFFFFSTGTRWANSS